MSSWSPPRWGTTISSTTRRAATRRTGRRRRSAIVPEGFADAAPVGELEKFPTPGIVTIAALAEAPFGAPADKQFKTLVMIGDGKPFAVVLRGMRRPRGGQAWTLGFALVRPATPEEIEPVMGAKPGSLGAVKGTIRTPRPSRGSTPTTRSASWETA